MPEMFCHYVTPAFSPPLRQYGNRALPKEIASASYCARQREKDISRTEMARRPYRPARCWRRRHAHRRGSAAAATPYSALRNGAAAGRVCAFTRPPRRAMPFIVPARPPHAQPPPRQICTAFQKVVHVGLLLFSPACLRHAIVFMGSAFQRHQATRSRSPECGRPALACAFHAVCRGHAIVREMPVILEIATSPGLPPRHCFPALPARHRRPSCHHLSIDLEEMHIVRYDCCTPTNSAR